MSKRFAPILLCLPAILCLHACDNVGGAFDRNTGGTGNQGQATFIQPMANQGVTVEGRPKVKNVFPKGSGWPGTVPIVVVFNESINESTVAPGGSTPPALQVRLTVDSGSLNPGGGQGGTEPGPPLAASYDFLLGGRVVVIRPAQAFKTDDVEQYDVVITSDLRDTDGVRFTSSNEKIIGTFTPDQDSSIVDGEVLTVLPVDNDKAGLRDGLLYTIFTKPPAQSSVTTGATGSWLVRTGSTAVDGKVSFPIKAAGLGASGQEGRIAEFKPDAVLAASTSYETVFNKNVPIKFGATGKLNFNNRTPFAKFTTITPKAAISVKIGNSPAGTTDKVSATNISNVLVDVGLPDSTVTGDLVEVRIYGLDTDGGTTGAVNYVDLTGNAPTNGAQTITLSVGTRLGTPAKPEFLEGPLVLAASVSRGSTETGYVVSDSSSTDPGLDVTAPTLVSPVKDPAGTLVIHYIDQEYLTFFGIASEDLHSASLVLDSSPAPAPGLTNATLFGTGGDGKFMFDPILLRRRTSALGFSLVITDKAGNIAPAIEGQIVQRGVVTGSLAGGTLTVEAYDEVTFAPLAGVTVLIDSGLPTTSITGRVTGTTATDGRAVFTGLAGPPAKYSVTLIKDGYDLVTLLDSPAGFMSLPLRPIINDTATIDGLVGYTVTSGTSVMLGCNIIDDVRTEEIKTSTATPTTIPSTRIRPNRPYVVTAFSGTFEATTTPTFANVACTLCGVTGLLKEAMQLPVVANAKGTQALALLPSPSVVTPAFSPYIENLATWPGLDSSNLAGTPTVRVLSSLWGMPGMMLIGVGYSKLSTGSSYTINGSYSLGIYNAIRATLGPKLWISTEATDKSGNLGRIRQIIDPSTNIPFLNGTMPGIPTITAQGGASTGSPSLTYEDRLNARSITSGGFAFQILTATDSSGRIWRMIEQDTTSAAAGVTRQFPVMTGVSTTGLKTGSWSMFAESVLIYSLTFVTGDYVLEELRREDVTYSRAAPKTFTIQ